MYIQLFSLVYLTSYVLRYQPQSTYILSGAWPVERLGGVSLDQQVPHGLVSAKGFSEPQCY